MVVLRRISNTVTILVLSSDSFTVLVVHLVRNWPEFREFDDNVIILVEGIRSSQSHSKICNCVEIIGSLSHGSHISCCCHTIPWIVSGPSIVQLVVVAFPSSGCDLVSGSVNCLKNLEPHSWNESWSGWGDDSWEIQSNKSTVSSSESFHLNPGWGVIVSVVNVAQSLWSIRKQTNVMELARNLTLIWPSCT